MAAGAVLPYPLPKKDAAVGLTNGRSMDSAAIQRHKTAIRRGDFSRPVKCLLRDGLVGSAIVICNDYEFELIRQKTGLDEDGVLAHTGALIVTRGEQGSTARYGTHHVSVPAVPPHSVVDPTGVGDAFRGGLLKGLAMGRDLEVSCRLGSMAATYALEHLGGSSHSYTWDEFVARYATHFGSL